jgi:DNA-binding transcriptional LysR family regulator
MQWQQLIMAAFVQAAEALNIKQSTLSRSILQLEHATSTRLFERSPAGVAVSRLGGDFIRMAKSALEEINEFDLSKAIPSHGEVLRIGFCTSLSARALRTNLLEFHSRFPKFQLEMLERRPVSALDETAERHARHHYRARQIAP